MQLVCTILGDIAPERLGVVNVHDHLIRVGAGEVYIDPDHQLAGVDKAMEEATRFVTASKNWAAAGTVVNMYPTNCGHDLNKLTEVNHRVPDLHVVAVTGFHRERVYLETQSHWVSCYTVDRIVDLLIADITEGIDANGYSGLIVNRTGHKAGVIKVTIVYDKITVFEHKYTEAVAVASITIGTPINTHTTYGTCGLEQAQELIRLGVVPEKIAIGHIQHNADIHYLTQTLETGIYLEIDDTYRTKYQPDSNRIMELRELGERGHSKRTLLGTDSGKRSYQKAYGSVTSVDFNPANDGSRMFVEESDRAYVGDLLMYNGQRFFAFVEED